MRSRLLLLAAAIAATAAVCPPPHLPTPPPAPAILTVAVVDVDTHATLVGAFVQSDANTGVIPRTFIGDSGSASFVLPHAGFNLCVDDVGYTSTCVPVAKFATQTLTVMLHAAQPPPPQHLDAGELGAWSFTNRQITLADGSTGRWKGISAFALLQQWEHDPDFGSARIDEYIGYGAHVFRVFTRFNGTPDDPHDQGIGNNSGLGHFDLATAPGGYAQLGAFVDVLATRHARAEIVALADAQSLSSAQQHAHLRAVCDAVRGKWNVSVEVANEPSVNGVDEVSDRTWRNDCPGVPLAAGTYDIGDNWAIAADANLYRLDYVTWHSSRDADWYDDGRTLEGIRDGGDLWPGAHTAVIADEPKGFAETPSPSRSSNPEEARWAGGIFALFGAGATFHCDDCIGGVALRPIQAAAAKAFFEGLSWPPVRAQFASYKRGCASTESGWPACVGGMALKHWDNAENTGHGSERTYEKDTDGFAWLIA
jgi:hypothetical protein